MIRSLLLRSGFTAFFLAAFVCRAHSQAPPFPPAPSLGPVVSVHQLQIPENAIQVYNKGVKRLAARDYAGSVPYFQKAIKEFPNFFEAYVGLGDAESNLQRWDDAESHFRKAIDLSRGRYAPADFGFGLILATVRKQWGDAEEILRDGLQLSPSDAIGNFLLGWVLCSTDRLPQAEAAAQNAVSLQPKFPGGLLLLAQVHFQQKRYAAVVDDLNRSLALGISGPQNDRIRAILAQAQSHLVSGDAGPNSALAATTP